MSVGLVAFPVDLIAVLGYWALGWAVAFGLVSMGVVGCWSSVDPTRVSGLVGLHQDHLDLGDWAGPVVGLVGLRQDHWDLGDWAGPVVGPVGLRQDHWDLGD